MPDIQRDTFSSAFRQRQSAFRQEIVDLYDEVQRNHNNGITDLVVGYVEHGEAPLAMERMGYSVTIKKLSISQNWYARYESLATACGLDSKYWQLKPLVKD